MVKYFCDELLNVNGESVYDAFGAGGVLEEATEVVHGGAGGIVEAGIILKVRGKMYKS